MIPFKQITELERSALTTIKCNWLVVFCQAEAIKIYSDLFGVTYKRPMVWIKPDCSPQFSGDRPAMGFESIVCAWRSGGRSRWNSGGKRGVYNYLSTSNRKTDHPTEKPEGLFRELIGDFSLNGIVFDPFLGSGTTAVACEQLNRKWIGIEISEKYCEIAARRLELETQQLKLFN
jgi:site-specific DNA-methyltransferase (adenine-specific)